MANLDAMFSVLPANEEKKTRIWISRLSKSIVDFCRVLVLIGILPRLLFGLLIDAIFPVVKSFEISLGSCSGDADICLARKCLDRATSVSLPSPK